MTPKSALLNRVLAADCCTGCGLCASAFADSKIRMKMIEPGYLRPEQIADLTSAEENLFAAICPGHIIEEPGSEAKFHPIWGPIVRVRVGAATDPAVRHQASSGGALSALLCCLLERGGIDHVVQTSASKRSPIENETVETRTKEHVLSAAGSRYSPSSPLAELDQHLAGPEPFALVGKPCDIAAVRALSKQRPEVTQKIPYMLSFFCAGIPSTAGTRQILREIGVSEDDLVSFRYRGEGWPGYAVAERKDGTTARMNYAESWGNILSHHTQFRCKICPDGTGGHADVACGDPWYSDQDGYPLFEEREGRSLIVTRTAQGEELVKNAIQWGYIQATEIDVAEIEKMQPSQARRKRLVLSRVLAMRLFKGFHIRFSGLKLREAASSASVYENVRSFLGMTRRLFIRLSP